MKEQIIAERTSIVAELKQLVQTLIGVNKKAKSHMSSNKADIKRLRKDNKELGKMKFKNSFFIRIFSLFFKS